MSYRGNSPDADPGQDERDDLARQRAAALRQHRSHMANPHPRDPEHEGAGSARDE